MGSVIPRPKTQGAVALLRFLLRTFTAVFQVGAWLSSFHILKLLVSGYIVTKKRVARPSATCLFSLIFQCVSLVTSTEQVSSHRDFPWQVPTVKINWGCLRWERSMGSSGDLITNDHWQICRINSYTLIRSTFLHFYFQ